MLRRHSFAVFSGKGSFLAHKPTTMTRVFIISAIFCAMLIFACEENPINPEDIPGPTGETENCTTVEEIRDSPDRIAQTLDTVALSEFPYLDTLPPACSPTGEDVAWVLISGPAGLFIHDSIVHWRPEPGAPDSVRVTAGLVAADDTLAFSWNIKVHTQENQTCPSYTRKQTVVGDPGDLPDGYVVFSHSNEGGVYRSRIAHFEPVLIRGTKGDQASSVHISDCGEWILYVKYGTRIPFLVKRDGSQKVVVPRVGCDPEYPTITGFYRESPYGTEIYYQANYDRINAVTVDFSGKTPKFGNHRTIADLRGEYGVHNFAIVNFIVSGDRIFGAVGPIADGMLSHRTGYLTIPDQGKGTAGPEHVYQWAHDDSSTMDGCGHALSHDGSLALAVAGRWGTSSCVPKRHKGFYITGFRYFDEPPMDMFVDHIQSNGISINWCPTEYRGASKFEVDFWGWYFGNRNDYVVGRLAGTRSTSHGIWLIEWATNTWTRISSTDSPIEVLPPAVFFGPTPDTLWIPDTSDTTQQDTVVVDSLDPEYEILYPRGGETFYIGDTCEIKITSRKKGNAGIFLVQSTGVRRIPLPGLNASLRPPADSIVTFVVRDSLTVTDYDVGAGEMVSRKIDITQDPWFLEIRDYNPQNNYHDRTAEPIYFLSDYFSLYDDEDDED